MYIRFKFVYLIYCIHISYKDDSWPIKILHLTKTIHIITCRRQCVIFSLAQKAISALDWLSEYLTHTQLIPLDTTVKRFLWSLNINIRECSVSGFKCGGNYDKCTKYRSLKQFPMTSGWWHKQHDGITQKINHVLALWHLMQSLNGLICIHVIICLGSCLCLL